MDIRSAIDGDVAVLAKTGTLNERLDRFKSLALAVGITGGRQPSAEFVCGLVVISYFEFHDAPRQRNTVLPPVHLEFARTHLTGVLQRHWELVSGCPAGADP